MNDDWDGTGISSFPSLMRETRRCDGAGMEEREREERRRGQCGLTTDQTRETRRHWSEKGERERQAKTDRSVERDRGQIGSDSFPFLPPPLSHRLKTKI